MALLRQPILKGSPNILLREQFHSGSPLEAPRAPGAWDGTLQVLTSLVG